MPVKRSRKMLYSEIHRFLPSVTGEGRRKERLGYEGIKPDFFQAANHILGLSSSNGASFTKDWDALTAFSVDSHARPIASRFGAIASP